MKLKVQTQITFIHPPLSKPKSYNGVGVHEGGGELALYKNLSSAQTPQEKESMQRQVESTDGTIDKLVYQLNWFNEAEVKIVEAAGLQQQ